MNNERITLTREELYQKVWEKPAALLAEEFGISDVAIAKICKKLKIPKPTRGYWRQIEVGHKLRPTPLPGIRQGDPKKVDIYPNRAKPPLHSHPPEVMTRIEAEKLTANRIVIAENLRNAHPLVSQARQMLEKATPDSYGRLYPSRRQGCLNLCVSKTSLNRALRILDALLKALEARGDTVEVSNKEPWETLFIIQGQKVKVGLMEKADRKENQIPAAGSSKPYLRSQDRWVYSPSGKLTFFIDDRWSDSDKKKWSDAQRPLEDQLNDVMIGLISAAECLRQKDIKLQEQHRKWKEAELRRIVEIQRRQSLETQSAAWNKAQSFRSFLEACESVILKRSDTTSVNVVEANWLAWARRYVDELDPLRNGGFEKMIHEFGKSD